MVLFDCAVSILTHNYERTSENNHWILLLTGQLGGLLLAAVVLRQRIALSLLESLVHGVLSGVRTLLFM